MAKLELLMSVMAQNDFALPKQSRVNGDLLMINQCDTEYLRDEVIDGHNWRMISTKERGLSRSRNMALDNATGDICKLCDDDEILVDDYNDIILQAYNDLPDADVIVFNLNRINYRMKKRYYKIESIRSAPTYRSYGSPMITFKLNRIREHNIRFHEEFGSGGKFGGGEDNLFIRDIRMAGLKMYEHPSVISTVDYGRFDSKWFHGYDDRYFYNLGVFHEYVNPGKWISNIIWGLYQVVKLRKEKINPITVVKWRLTGAKGYRNGKLSYEEYINTLKNG